MRRGRKNLPLWLGVLIIAAAIAVCFALDARARAEKPDGEAQIHFIDVGQGDAALIVTPEASVMIDAGPTDVRFGTANYVSRVTDSLDMMILTHPHEDHIGGAAEILRSVPVKTVVMPDVVSDAGAFERLLGTLGETDAEAKLAGAGDVYEFGALRITVLAPCGTEYEEMNDYSIVVRVDYGRRSAIFTGDAEQRSECEIVDSWLVAALSCDVLKVGHHGSASSSCAEFLSALRPKIAVISVGADNDYGHPKSEVLSRLRRFGAETVLRTDEQGTIVLVTDGDAQWRQR